MSFKSLKSAAAAAAGVIVSSLLVPGIAAAHTGVGATHGFSHGFLHPILGLDHLLAMVLVGVVAAGLEWLSLRGSFDHRRSPGASAKERAAQPCITS